MDQTFFEQAKKLVNEQKLDNVSLVSSKIKNFKRYKKARCEKVFHSIFNGGHGACWK